MIRRPPRSTRKESSAASDVYKRQHTESEGAKISDDLKLAEPISYQLHRLEFDYKNESIKTQSVVIYDKNGTTLASYTDKYSLERFEPIIPGSIG